MQHWPEISGNAINGLGETIRRRPSPIYWQPPGSTPHSHLQAWFYSRPMSEEMLAARKERQQWLEAPLAELAPEPLPSTPEQLSSEVKDAAIAFGADAVGIARMDPAWVFEGSEIRERWVIVFGVAQDYAIMQTAPKATAGAEVIRQYARGTRIAKQVASWLRQRGHDARPLSGPLSGPLVMIPAAIAAGLGQLGKHGSVIHRRLGANFRLSVVLTDAPVEADVPDEFGSDDFCASCRLCADVCPPQAIAAEKQWVRGELRWYVDFDRCLPYFNEHHGCAMCMAACPWSRPGIADGLIRKLARVRSR